MSGCLSVSRELHLSAPEHIAVYSQSPSYTSRAGRGLIEVVIHEGRTASGLYYNPTMYRRRSANNGLTWVADPPLAEVSEDEVERGYENYDTPMHYLDPDNDRLLTLYGHSRRGGHETGWAARGESQPRTHRFFTQVSADGGATWSEARQLVCAGAQFDEEHWAPGVWYGKNGLTGDLTTWLKLPDGTVVTAVNRQPIDEHGEFVEAYPGHYYFDVPCLRGRWRPDLSGLDWELGEPMTVSPEGSTIGGCEASLAHLGGETLWATLRCQGHPDQLFPSLRFTSVSTDGGRTWGETTPLCYEDGEPVYTPACLGHFWRFSHSDKLFFISNVRPDPVYAQTPRYPLVIGELDQERFCLIRESLTILDNWHEPLPRDVRFTNWGMYEDRETGELVLTLPVEPKVSWDDLTSDCYRYRVALNGA